MLKEILVDATREIDSLRQQLSKLEDKTHASIESLVRLETASEEKFSNILACLTSIQKDLDTMRESVTALNSLATKGQTSLETLLWVGGAIAAVTTFFATLYSYFPN